MKQMQNQLKANDWNQVFTKENYAIKSLDPVLNK